MTNYKTNWDLPKYFYSSLTDSKIAEDKQTATDLIETFIANYETKIASLSPAGFVEMFQQQAQFSFYLNKISQYYYLLSSLDTQDLEAQKAQSQYYNSLTEIENKLLFVNQEMKLLGKEKLQNLANQPEVAAYRNYFLELAQNLKYILAPEIEQVVNLKNLGGNLNSVDLFDEYLSSLKFTLQIPGQEDKILTMEEVRALRSSPNPQERKAAFEAINTVLSNNSNQMVLSGIYKSILKDWSAELKFRKFQSVLSPRNLSENLDDLVVEKLLQVVSQNYSLVQKFLKLKQKVLGYQTFWIYDSMAPIASTKTEVEFDEAVQIFTEAISEFDPEFASFSQEMLTSGRVDVYPKPGKRNGAYAIYQKDFPSFILLNYTKTIDDVSTLAHEMGHAIHGHFSQAQPLQVFDTGMSLAETASVFNETLFAEKLLSKLDDKQAKIEFLDRRITDIYSTIFVQVMYTLFEKEVHQAYVDGNYLSREEINTVWQKHRDQLYGDIFSYPENHLPVNWLAIPHFFHTPFYCYSYAFGNLLSFSLYEIYKEKGASFVADYKKILASGGSKSPAEILSEVGLDLNSGQFFEKGIQVFSSLVDQFEELVS